MKKEPRVRPVEPGEPSYPAFHAVLWNRLPEIDLYMDQLLLYVERLLGCFWHREEVQLTASMVNNYVKQRVIPAPVRKQYSRQHIALLVMLLTLKYVYSLEQIKLIFSELEEDEEALARTYDWFVRRLEPGATAEPPAGGPALEACHYGLVAFIARQEGLYRLALAASADTAPSLPS